MCSIATLVRPNGDEDIEHVVPIARQYEHDAAQLDPKLQILPDSSSNADSEKEGLRVTLGGGKNDRSKLRQTAVIEFLCLGAEGRRRRSSTAAAHSGPVSDRRVRAAEDEDGEEPPADDEDPPDSDWEAQKSTDDGHGGTLTFLSYKEDDVAGTLHLEWRTKYACRDYDRSTDPDDDGSTGGGGGWGFFGWLFFLAFLGVVVYFAFFAWVNYSKYGASGWDLLPHSDALRDLPYILGDWGRKVIGTVTGGPSRGGYSAV